MTDNLLILAAGVTGRLEAVLHTVLAGRGLYTVESDLSRLPDLRGKRVVFAVSLDETGISEPAFRLLGWLRSRGQCLSGSCAAFFVDGAGELYTKQYARMLMLAVNQAGAWLMGKPLLEATGSLRNLTVRAKRLGVTLEEAYVRLASELLDRLAAFQPPSFRRMRLLMLHASNQSTSNTLGLGHAVLERLPETVTACELSLRNGTIYDCKGCTYRVCAHFAEKGTCFYGGTIAEDVFPAILDSDVLLMLCPNYNDAIGANLMALINRFTSLTVNNLLEGKLIYGIVVSGYSGSDLVAEQLLGALCLNKAFTLPPRCCWMETANDPLSVLRLPEIETRIGSFAAQIVRDCMAEPIPNTENTEKKR